MPSQRPYFLSSFIAAFRQQTPALQTPAQQPNKHSASPSSASPAANAYQHHQHQHHHHHQQQQQQQQQSVSTSTASATPRSPPAASVSYHSPRHGGAIPIPGTSSPGRRRGSDSSSEGFREVLGADKWYIGGRTATGDEKFFKLGVVKRVKSNDGLSLDRLSL